MHTLGARLSRERCCYFAPLYAMVQRRPFRIGTSYDTLDAAPEHAMCSEAALHAFLIAPMLQHSVGIILSGLRGVQTRASAFDRDWGRPLRLASGESLHVRVLPKGTMGMAVPEGECRIVAFRRVPKKEAAAAAGAARPTTGLLVLHTPRAMDQSNPCLSNALPQQLLTPTLFGCKAEPGALAAGPTGPDGRAWVPATMCSIKGSTHAPDALCIRPDTASIAIAAYTCGMHIPAQTSQTVCWMTPSGYSSCMQRQTAALSLHAGAEAASRAVQSGLVVLDMLSACGILALACNPALRSALPDALHCPFGISFALALSSRVATHASCFSLPPAGTHDESANNNVCTSFESRWQASVNEKCRAIDAAIKFGLDYVRLDDGVHEAAAADRTVLRVTHNLVFWQYTGQQLNSQLTQEPLTSPRLHTASPTDTRFGPAELVTDALSSMLHSAAERQLSHRRVNMPYTVHDKLASQSMMRAHFNAIQDEVETWIRTGTYQGKRAQRPLHAEAAHDATSPAQPHASPHVQDYMDDCALHDAVMLMEACASHGPVGAGSAVALECYVVCAEACEQCCECNRSLDVVQSVMYRAAGTRQAGAKSGSCSQCLAAASAAAAQRPPPQ